MASENPQSRIVYRLSFFRRLLFAVFLVPSALATAQKSGSHATLLGWEQRTLNFMLDRSHNYGGTNYNRGLFREHIGIMSPEHEIDLLTYRFTPAEDYNRIPLDNTYQANFGSLNATNFAVEHNLKTKVELDKRNAFSIHAMHEENLRASRFLFLLEYEHGFNENHHIGGRHTVSNEKSDLDLTVYYRYGTFSKGMAEIDITLLDWAANIVQNLAEDSKNEYNTLYPETYWYQVHPVLFSLRLISPYSGYFRAELVAGFQSFSQKEISLEGETFNFIDKEWAHYIGGLLEYFNDFFTTGLTYQRTSSKLKRAPKPDSDYTLDFGNWQFSDRFGFYAISRLGKFRAEQWVWYEQNTDRLQGEKVPGNLTPLELQNKHIPFNFVEKRIKIKSRALYDPPNKGIKTSLEFHADYRYPQGEKDPRTGIRNQDFRRVYPVVRDRNDRLTFTIGYRVNRHFYFLGGVSYDIDNDSQSGIGLPRVTETTRFDGGFGRISVEW